MFKNKVNARRPVIQVAMQYSRAMPTPLPLLLVLIALCSGCFDGRQKGKFAVSSSGECALANHPGSLVILRGHALTRDNQPTGADVPLLHVLIVCPGLKANGSGSDSSEGTYRSIHKLTWFATPNDVTSEFSWDRARNIVEIHGQQYDRVDGSIFVVVRHADGTVTSWQVNSIDGNIDEKDLLRHIREQLPKNQIIADVELVERDAQ